MSLPSVLDFLPSVPKPAPGARPARGRPAAEPGVRDFLRLDPVRPAAGLRPGSGETIYQQDPEAIVRAIRAAEGVPSYGNMALAARYGGHERVPEDTGRAATRRLVDLRYKEWTAKGKPGDYLEYLRDRYAPLGAANDPTGLNRNWLPNVRRNLGEQPVPQIPSAVRGRPEPSERDLGLAPFLRPQTPQEQVRTTRDQQLRELEEGGRVPPSIIPRLRQESERTGLTPREILDLRAPELPAFLRGVLGAIPGFRGGEERLEERRRAAAEKLSPEERAKVLRAPPAETRGQRVARVAGELGGGLVGFGLMTGPALQAAIGTRIGTALAGRIAPALAGIAKAAGEGALFGALDVALSDYDRLRQMSPDEAVKYAGAQVGLTGAEFVAFTVGFRALHRLIRAGLVTKQTLGEIADAARGAREAPLPAVPPGAEAPAARQRVLAQEAARAAEAVPSVRGRIETPAERARVEAQVAEQARAEEATLVGRIRQLRREKGGVVLGAQRPRGQVIIGREAIPPPSEVPPPAPVAPPVITEGPAAVAPPRRGRQPLTPREQEALLLTRTQPPEIAQGAPVRPLEAVQPAVLPTPPVEPQRPLAPAAAVPEVPTPAPGVPEPSPTVIEQIRQRRAKKAGVFTVAQVQGDATAAPIEQRSPVRLGRTTSVSSVAGDKAKAQFAIVEADAPTVSHTAEGQPNPAYPAALQRRMRGRASALETVRAIRERLDPEQLGQAPLGNFGAPTLGKDGLVEAGNGRMMALRQLYQEGHPNAERYKGWLREHAAEFGLRPEDVDAVKRPVLVRIRREAVPDRLKWAEDLNTDPQLAMSDTETALRDAGRLSPEILAQVRPSDLTSAENRPFVRAFVEAAVPTAERNRVVDAQGVLSQSGVTRIRNALFARAYGGEELDILTRITESTDDTMRTLGKALIGASPKWARVREGQEAGNLWPELDLVGRGILPDAVNTYARLKDPSSPVDVKTWLQQGVLIGEADIAPEGRELVRGFQQYARSQQKTQAFLEGIADRILESGSPRAGGLLETPQAPALTRILQAGHERVAEAEAGAVFAAAKPTGYTPEIIAINLDAYDSLPSAAKALIARAANEATGRQHIKTTAQAVVVGRRAYDVYQAIQDPTKPALTREWFETFIIARTFGEPGALDAATLRDPTVPLTERLDAATTNPERTVRQLSPRPRRKKGPQPPEYPPIGGGAEKQQGFLRLREAAMRATEPARAVGEVTGGALRGWVRRSDTLVARMGEEGADLVRRRKLAENESRLRAGDHLADVDKAWKPGPNRTSAFDRIRMYREGTKITLYESDKKLLAVIDPYLNEMVVRARRSGPPVEEMPGEKVLLDLGMEKLPTRGLDVGELPNYWPIMIDELKATRHRKPAEVIREIMERTGADAEGAERMLRNLLAGRRSGRPFGNLERTREQWVPHVFRLSAEQEYIRYVQGAERRLAQARAFGPHDQIMNAHFADIRLRNPQDAAFAEAWFDAVTGMRPKEVVMENLARQVTGLQVGAKMIFSVISNASQTANLLLKGDLTTFGRTWVKLLHGSTRAEMLDFSKRTGAVLESSLREIAAMAGVTEGGVTRAERVGEATISRTGFMRVEGSNRIVAAAFGREWARDLAAAYARLSGKNVEVPFLGYWRRRGLATLERQMRELNIDPAKILERVDRKEALLTVGEERLAGLTMSDLTQFSPSAGEIPLFWSHPWGRVLTQFSVFAYKQGELVWNAVVGEARHGNFKPLLVFLSVFPLVGEAVADIRLLLRRGPGAAYRGFRREGVAAGARDFFGVLAERPTNPIERGLENMAYVGGIGVASNMIRALESRNVGEAVASTLAGPTGADVFEVGAAVGRTAQDIQREAAYQRGEPVKRPTFTGARRLARKAVSFTVTPALTGALGLPGAALGRAIEGAPVFRSPESRRRELASKIADAIARGDREAARRLQTEYRGEFGTPADITAILRARRQRQRPRRLERVRP